MDISLYTYYLKDYAEKKQWQNATLELCQNVIGTIFSTPPTEKSWLTLLELFAAWPNATDINQWVIELEPKIGHWPWKMRESILGQKQTRGDKNRVYRLIGYLHIREMEDLYGQKLVRWSQDENWKNLKGISLHKVETEAGYLSTFLQSPYLQNLHTLNLTSLDSLGDQMGTVFNNTQLPYIRELILRSLCLTIKDVITLSSLYLSHQISVLDISSNFIYGKDLSTILNPESFPNLEILNISYTTINCDELNNAIANQNHPALKQIVFEGTQASQKSGLSVINL